MKTLAVPLIAIAAVAVFPAWAQDTAATARAVRAADIAFDKRAQDVGAAQAFAETVDETDGLRFGGGPPSRGAAAVARSFAAESPPGSRLHWTPLDARGSASGDMGVTAGTWTFTGAGPMITGRYVTVWRRNAAGAWKALIDIGNPDPK